MKKQINSRLSKLQNLSEIELELNKFLVNTFNPLLEEVDQKFYKYWPSESVNKKLANEKMILSPSDFGLLRYSIAVVSAIHRQGQGDI